MSTTERDHDRERGTYRDTDAALLPLDSASLVVDAAALDAADECLGPVIVGHPMARGSWGHGHDDDEGDEAEAERAAGYAGDVSAAIDAGAIDSDAIDADEWDARHLFRGLPVTPGDRLAFGPDAALDDVSRDFLAWLGRRAAGYIETADALAGSGDVESSRWYRLMAGALVRLGRDVHAAGGVDLLIGCDLGTPYLSRPGLNDPAELRGEEKGGAA